MIKLVLTILIFNIIVKANSAESNIYCMNDNGSWYWLNKMIITNNYSFDLERYSFIPNINRVKIDGNWNSVFIHENSRHFKYFIVDKGKAEIQKLSSMCKNLFGENYYPYSSNPNDYYSNYILVESYLEASVYYNNNYEKYQFDLYDNNSINHIYNHEYWIIRKTF